MSNIRMKIKRVMAKGNKPIEAAMYIHQITTLIGMVQRKVKGTDF